MSMMQKAAQAVGAYFVAQGMICREDGEFSAYALECGLSSLVHLLVLGVSAFLVGLTAPAIGFQVMFSALKKRIGGCHAGSHATCIGGSVLLALVLGFGATLVTTTLSLPVICAAVMLMLGLVFWKAPVVHPHNPKTPQQLQTCRRKAVRAAGLEGLGVFCCCWLLPASFTPVVIAGTLGGAAAAVSLLPPVPSHPKKGGNDDESTADESCPANREIC